MNSPQSTKDSERSITEFRAKSLAKIIEKEFLEVARN